MGLNGRTWVLCFMIFGFHLVDLSQSFLNIPALWYLIFIQIYGFWSLKGNSCGLVKWFSDYSIVDLSKSNFCIHEIWNKKFFNQYINSRVERVGAEFLEQWFLDFTSAFWIKATWKFWYYEIKLFNQFVEFGVLRVGHEF